MLKHRRCQTCWSSQKQIQTGIHEDFKTVRSRGFGFYKTVEGNGTRFSQISSSGSGFHSGGSNICCERLCLHLKRRWEFFLCYSLRSQIRSSPPVNGTIRAIASLDTVHEWITTTENTQPVFCHLVHSDLSFCFFLQRETKRRPHPEVALPPKSSRRVTMLKTTVPRHLFVIKCTERLITGPACLWRTEKKQQHSRSDRKKKS